MCFLNEADPRDELRSIIVMCADSTKYERPVSCENGPALFEGFVQSFRWQRRSAGRLFHQICRIDQSVCVGADANDTPPVYRMRCDALLKHVRVKGRREADLMF